MTKKIPDLRVVEDFLEEAGQFQLGHLTTEARHPDTLKLAEWSRSDLAKAVQTSHQVELKALEAVAAHHLPSIEAMREDIERALSNGGRVFLAGCGSTGRLSVCLEAWWRESVQTEGLDPRLESSVIAFIAGGDYALVRSIENFEDHPEYGARQLIDAGFTKQDLLIASSEGGETPFVIGAVEAAMAVGPELAPYFVFCNPAEQLHKLERCRALIQAADQGRVRCVSLVVGPMALSGSTRLQASSALTLAIGAALFSSQTPRTDGAGPLVSKSKSCRFWIETSLRIWRELPLAGLDRLIEAEAEIYKAGQLCQHRTHRYGLTVLTDTTERTPTFNLAPFSNKNDAVPIASPTSLHVPGMGTSREAWRQILKRAPRALGWENFASLYGDSILEGFDFSENAPHSNEISIDVEAGELVIRLSGLEWRVSRPDSVLLENLLLKSVLNLCSTLVMGRLGRFESNLMLHVRSTNKKLIDRSVRYVQALLEEKGIAAPSYGEITRLVFELQSQLPPGQSVVLKTVERCLQAVDIAREFKSSARCAPVPKKVG